MVSAKLSKSLLVISSQSNQLINYDALDSSVQSPNQTAPQHQVYVGNLKHDVATGRIIAKLQELLLGLKVHVPKNRFSVYLRKSRKHPCKYAFISLDNAASEKLAFQLNSLDDPEIVINGHKLLVQKRFATSLRQNKNIELLFGGGKGIIKSKSVPTICTAEDNTTVQDEQLINGTTCKRHFYLGQHLPGEDRVTEYKRGSGNYIKNILISHIRKYVCAFLNSEGGRLMIGVDDNCTVYGITCNRKQEDQARCQIDNAIKRFQPHVMPNLYGIDFIPVKLGGNQGLEITNSSDPLLKVLEVSVTKPSSQNSLYENDKEEIFIRRDGSIEGPLKPSQIIEWCRINFTANEKVEYVSDDIVLASENYRDNVSLEQLESSIRENQKTLEDKIKGMLEMFKRHEEVILSELRQSKENSERMNKELCHIREYSNENTWCFSCTIL